ncbi:unnamed protein product [Rhizophagus irregularis]|nr:unnamed protein product [Rhizophagus irregularis]
MAQQQKSSLAEIPEDPTIVLFGDPRSGKSSVLKRLTGGLPLTGIRTHSIVEIRLLQAEEPLRKISLRYIEDKNHQPISPWEITFAIITELDEEEIEEKLYEAQRYVRNPSIKDVKHTRLPPDIDELYFTKNSVCVTISGPDQMYNLSMVELPGVVRNDESHEQFVLSLVKEYIKKESAILVPIFQATSDINMQCAHRLAREADPTGQRTVGVLTKMDRIVDVDYPCDDEIHLERAIFVNGQGENKLVNGTYVIRNPTNSEMREDPDELEKETIKDLKQIRIWRKVPSDRFGLHNLIIKLYERVRTCCEKLAEISEIPEIPEDPTIVLFGDPRSGKSSVLKRLTGGLPLTGIRTLSIVEIRLLQAEEPLRKISLRYIEDKNHQPISPWEITFAIITELNEEEIEEKLHEAQRYVRNPSIKDAKHTRLPPDIDELYFTKNSVCVTISGPDQMYNLSMVELPGVVRNDESHEIFALSLIKEYIKKESAILVPIFQATSDINTQCAHRLAREADPTGQRTVGVLTKMDRIVDVDCPYYDEQLLELATLVKGQGKYKFVNGTYVIRNPTNSEIREDPDELEKETIKALKQIRIWRNVPSDRYGLHNLTIKLYERVRTCCGLSQIDNQPKLPVSYESNETSLVYLLF